jgi:hypothetical protein
LTKTKIGYEELGLPRNPADLNRGAIAPTLNATLHGLSGIMVIASSPIVFTLLGRSLGKNPKWFSKIRIVKLATAATWIGLLLFPISLSLYNLAQQPSGFDFRVIVSAVNHPGVRGLDGNRSLAEYGIIRTSTSRVRSVQR